MNVSDALFDCACLQGEYNIDITTVKDQFIVVPDKELLAKQGYVVIGSPQTEMVELAGDPEAGSSNNEA
jgi:hypothetical protein